MEKLKASNKDFDCHPTDKLNSYDCEHLLNLTEILFQA